MIRDKQESLSAVWGWILKGSSGYSVISDGDRLPELQGRKDKLQKDQRRDQVLTYIS